MIVQIYNSLWQNEGRVKRKFYTPIDMPKYQNMFSLYF